MYPLGGNNNQVMFKSILAVFHDKYAWIYHDRHSNAGLLKVYFKNNVIVIQSSLILSDSTCLEVS